MKSRIALLCGLAMLSGLAAMAASDFSGTWALDKEKSDPMMMGRPKGGGGRAGNIDVKLTIKQTAEEVQISQTMSMGGQERTLDQNIPLDGKEFKVDSQRGTFKGTAKWNKDKLEVAGTRSFTGGDGSREIETKDIYALSADGKVLTVTSTTYMPNGERTRKQVFNKQ